MKRIVVLVAAVSLLLVGAFAPQMVLADNGVENEGGEVNQRSLTRLEIVAKIAGVAPGALKGAGIQGVLDAIDSGETDAITCAIEDSLGNPVTTINALSQGGDGAYWFRYNSGGAESSSIQFIGIPLFTESPLEVVYQRFNPTASPATNIATPFGIPFWGGNLTSGNWLLIETNGVDPAALCFFTVAP